MDLILLDDNFDNLPYIINNYESYILSNKWFETGGFDLTMPTVNSFEMFDEARYIYNQDNDDCAIITKKTSEGVNGIIINGKSLEHLMSWRVINEEISLDDTVENAVRDVVTRFAIAGNRAITRLELAPLTGYTEHYTGVTETGKTLESWLYDTLKPYEMSYRIKYNYVNNTLTFSVVKGLDRTQDQMTNTPATFSTDLKNITDILYENDDSNLKNFAYINGEYNNNTVTEIIDNTSGGERREIYLKPSISSDESDISTLDKYKAVLRQKGIEALTEYKIIESASCTMLNKMMDDEDDENDTLEYGVDYNIGDICDLIIPELGLMWSVMITAVDIVYDRNGTNIYPKFGEDDLTDIQYIERAMKN